ncbi:hypothetical protein MMC11_002573 [Xylographa trunciseda]|nr:hypothetical protein [Xylographa trunciseda]
MEHTIIPQRKRSIDQYNTLVKAPDTVQTATSSFKSCIKHAVYVLEDDDAQAEAELADISNPPSFDAIVDRLVPKTTIDFKAEELEDFISETQPDDQTRHRIALLSLPASKIWSEEDLHDDHFIRVGLMLLYNLCQGRQGLSLSKSIHIHYRAFPKHIIEGQLRMTQTLCIGWLFLLLCVWSVIFKSSTVIRTTYLTVELSAPSAELSVSFTIPTEWETALSLLSFTQ